MNSILRRCSEEPVGLTYLAIGSCPHITPEYPLTPKSDQLFPLCFHERVMKDKQPMRLIHFDPAFSKTQDLLASYWKDLMRVEWDEGYHWVSESLDVLVVPDCISQTDHLWFFESLVETILETKGKLIIQDYTGTSLRDLTKKLYDSCPQKELFQRRILVDMTYDTDCGCSTDMTVVQPFYDLSSNFLPLQWMSPQELKRWCGLTPKLDTLLLKRARGHYLESLNTIHVDYRRKRQGIPLLSESPDYTKDASCQEILAVLRSKLLPLADLLQTLRGSSLSLRLQELFDSAETDDMYKWYEKAASLGRP